MSIRLEYLYADFYFLCCYFFKGLKKKGKKKAMQIHIFSTNPGNFETGQSWSEHFCNPFREE